VSDSYEDVIRCAAQSSQGERQGKSCQTLRKVSDSYAEASLHPCEGEETFARLRRHFTLGLTQDKKLTDEQKAVIVFQFYVGLIDKIQSLSKSRRS